MEEDEIGTRSSQKMKAWDLIAVSDWIFANRGLQGRAMCGSGLVHLSNPYPSEEAKEELAKKCSITVSQVRGSAIGASCSSVVWLPSPHQNQVWVPDGGGTEQ